MSNIYSHYVLANKCVKAMPEDLRKIVETNRDIYIMGSVGLDFYFYYRILFDSKMFRYASASPQNSFSHYAALFHQNLDKTDDRNKAIAYITGFLTHYLLDNAVHDYVEKKMEVSDVTHGLIEAQFDGYLLRKDGFRPSAFYQWQYVKNTDENVRIIWQLFGDFSFELYKGFWKSGKRLYRFFRTGIPVYGSLVRPLMKLAKMRQGFIDQLYTDDEDPRCADSNLRLEKLLNRAFEEFCQCGPQTIDDIISGRKLPERYEENFSVQPDWQNEVVLDYEKEKEYVLK
ncbi:MAG: zinc dependent phospholipase C family protein [Erysipelotrichaceae bacterium]|nr:zinc dependent phospholipase C family protein [Erysipelotrichaceae bacterium]